MKYSIRGNLNMSDGSPVVALLNKYVLWRLETRQTAGENEQDNISFEVWLNTETQKNGLFNELKSYVDEYGEMIDWHECTHDELISKPCVISETYTGGE